MKTKTRPGDLVRQCYNGNGRIKASISPEISRVKRITSAGFAIVTPNGRPGPQHMVPSWIRVTS